MSEAVIYEAVRIFAETIANVLLVIYESGGNMVLAIIVLLGIIKLLGRVAQELVEAVIFLVMSPLALGCIAIEKWAEHRKARGKK